MFFVLMSNKTLLLPNYYVYSSINYIINITKNVYTALIAERLRVCGSSKSWAGQIIYCSELQTVCHCFNIYASIPIDIALALRHGYEPCKLVTCFVVIRQI